MKLRTGTFPLMAIALVPLFIFSGLSLPSKTDSQPGTGLPGPRIHSHLAAPGMHLGTGDAFASKTDTVTILKTQWQPRKRREFRVIVIANTDAKLGTVKLHAQVYSGDLVIKAGQLTYHKPKKHYRKIFTFVRTPPDRVVVRSSGGGSAVAPVSRSAYESK
jgi:hypothetical protein